MGRPGLITHDAHRFAPAAPEEDIVHGACCPGWHSAAEHAEALDQWISFMKETGIRRVCCLIAGRRLEASDANVGRYRRAFGAHDICHAPIPHDRVVSRERLREEILPFLRASADRDVPVVVHSVSGLGRTGYVLPAWLVSERGYGPVAAIDTVTEMGRDPLEPITRGQETRRDLIELLESVQ